MTEVHTFGNGKLVFVLPRGGHVIQQVFTRINENVIHALEECAALWARENAEVVKSVKDAFAADRFADNWIACETSYFRDLSEYASRYALPSDTAGDYRRFGADGLFHQWAALQFPPGERIVSVCLDDAPNAAAIRQRIPVGTTGGYSQLEGAAGRTTCGDLDPMLLLTLVDQGKTPEELATLLNEESGWQAFAGENCTFDQLLTKDIPGSVLARTQHFNNTLKMIGAMLASLGCADRIVIGCKSPKVCTGYIAELRKALLFTSIPIFTLQINRAEIMENLLRLDD